MGGNANASAADVSSCACGRKSDVKGPNCVRGKEKSRCTCVMKGKSCTRKCRCRTCQNQPNLDEKKLTKSSGCRCGINKKEKFQSCTDGVHFNAIIYKGPETQKPIYLYHHDGHYDVITSMPAFLGRVYFCLKCEKGYKTEDWRHHSCANKYRCCHHIACPNQGKVGSWIPCARCHRIFKGPGCFENHQRVGVKGGKSVCQTYSKCQKWGKVADVSQGEDREGGDREEQNVPVFLTVQGVQNFAVVKGATIRSLPAV